MTTDVFSLNSRWNINPNQRPGSSRVLSILMGVAGCRGSLSVADRETEHCRKVERRNCDGERKKKKKKKKKKKRKKKEEEKETIRRFRDL